MKRDPLRSFVRNGIELFDYEQLVWSRARRRWAPRFSSRADVEDFYQVGWIGLIECADHFDHSRGVAFMSLAYRYVDGFILSECYALEWEPHYLLVGKRKLAPEQRRTLRASSDVFPTDLSAKNAMESREARPDWRSSLREAYVDLTKRLAERERLVLGARVLGGHTQPAIAQALGVSPQRVDQIVKNATKKARESGRPYQRRLSVRGEETWRPSPPCAEAVSA